MEANQEMAPETPDVPSEQGMQGTRQMSEY